MLKHEFINDGKTLVIAMLENLEYGCISKSGKSFTYRIKGSYLNSRGQVIDYGEGVYSPYLHTVLSRPVTPKRDKFYHKSDLIKHNFDGLIMTALKIDILKIN